MTRILDIINLDHTLHPLGPIKMADSGKNSDDTKDAPFTKLLRNSFPVGKKISNRQKTGIIKEIFRGLNNRNVQIHFKDEKLQRNTKELMWGGSFANEKCQECCYSDFLSLVESNFTGNSGDVRREFQLSISFEEALVKRKLEVYFENEGIETYKAYQRLFAETDVGFSPVTIFSAEGDKKVDPDTSSLNGLKEAGVYFEVKPHETLGVTFNWEGSFSCDFGAGGEYRLFWRKQAGVSEYPVTISISSPNNAKLLTEPQFSLTEEGIFRYNTSLDRDLVTRVFGNK